DRGRCRARARRARRAPAPPSARGPARASRRRAATPSEVVLFEPRPLAVGVDHDPDKLVEAHGRLPAELLARLRIVADQQVDLGRAQVALVEDDVVAPVEVDVAERLLEELANRVRLAGREHVVVRLVRLEHPPGALHVVGRVAPVALRVRLPSRSSLCSPRRIAPIARVILRVTKVGPRRGDSWLKRIPLTAYIR